MQNRGLHNGTFLPEYIKLIKAELIEEIKSLDGEKNLDFENEKDRLLKKYKLGPLKLGEPIPSKPKRKQKQIRNHWGQQMNTDIQEMEISLPFEGNGNLFYCSPSSYTHVYPKIDYIDIQRQVIIFTIELEELSEELYKREINNVISNIKVNIPNVNAEISGWDNNLQNFITTELSRFESFLTQKNNFFESIGLKVSEKADKYITPSPITRKSVPVPKLEESGNIKKIHPKLKEEVYQDIITTLNNVGRAIERKPSLYKNKDEEDLRDMFLLFLETRYEGTSATGETFNKKGKSDILLKYANDGSNLFIGECKIWKGSKKFLETIDQILGYLTWQDSKSAILLFVDNESLEKVKNTVSSSINNHKNYSSMIQQSNDSFTYILNLPEDNSVRINMEIIFFHLPGRK